MTSEGPSAPNVPDVSPPRRSRMYSSDREWAALTASVTAELTASAPSSNSSGAMVTEMGVCWPVSTTFTIPSRAVASISVCTGRTREKVKGAAAQTVRRERQWVGGSSAPTPIGKPFQSARCACRTAWLAGRGGKSACRQEQRTPTRQNCTRQRLQGAPGCRMGTRRQRHCATEMANVPMHSPARWPTRWPSHAHASHHAGGAT